MISVAVIAVLLAIAMELSRGEVALLFALSVLTLMLASSLSHFRLALGINLKPRQKLELTGEKLRPSRRPPSTVHSRIAGE
jgi:hypothetical protein